VLKAKGKFISINPHLKMRKESMGADICGGRRITSLRLAQAKKKEKVARKITNQHRNFTNQESRY
jgi:hypothetical protein